MKENFKTVDGIKCYALHRVAGESDYSPEYFERLVELEDNNFWFKCRNRIIKTLLGKFSGRSRPVKMLEIGCGTGCVLNALSLFDNYMLSGAELYLEGLKYARKRLPNIEFMQLDAREIPFDNEFDVIGAFDVLEHIEEDTLIMKNVNKALKNNGFFF